MTRDYLATVGTDGNIGGPGGSPISPALTGFALSAAAVVATSNLTLSGFQTIDGYTTLAADRVLLTGQTVQSQNGVWSAASGAWTRPTDFASGAVFTGTRTIQIINGTVYGASTWMLATNNVTVDTTAQGWQWQNGLATARPIVSVNLLDHQVSGTVGVGSATADTAAFAAARNAAVGYATAGFAVTVEVPAGSFQINTSGIFSNISSTSIPGFLWQGRGKRATFIQLVPSGSALWFYDNGSSQRTLFAQFRDICFQGDGTTNSNGFKFTSTGNEQGSQFWGCQFGDSGGLGFGGTLFDFEGSVGNDSHKLIGCRIAFCSGDIFLWNNPQAVTIELFATNIELGWGNIFHIGTGGGGDLHVYGGDCLMDGLASSAPMTYHIQVDESNNVGTGNGYAHFYGTKFEIRSPTVGLVNAPSVSNLGNFDFHYHDCGFNVVNGNGLNGASIGAARTAVIVGNKRSVHFTNCHIPSEFNYQLAPVAGSASANGNAGLIQFEKCSFVPSTVTGITDDVSSRFSFPDTWGRARAKDCFYAGNPSQRYSLDFDLNSAQTAAGEPAAIRKIASLIPPSLTWPADTGVAEKTTVLPKGCKIVGVYLLKPAHGSNNGTQALFIGSNDKTIVYGTVSGSQKNQLGFAISPPTSSTPGFVDTTLDASDPNERTVRLWSTGSSLDNQAGIGGYAFVEYI